MCGTHQKAMLYQSDFPITSLPRWWIDCWSNYQISTALATSCSQAQAQNGDGLCLNSILFVRQCHTSSALSASQSWCHNFCGTVWLCLTGRGLMMSLDQQIIRHRQMVWSPAGYQELHSVYRIPTSKLLPSVKAYRHLPIPAGFCVPWYGTGSWDTARDLSQWHCRRWLPSPPERDKSPFRAGALLKSRVQRCSHRVATPQPYRCCHRGCTRHKCDTLLVTRLYPAQGCASTQLLVFNLF